MSHSRTTLQFGTIELLCTQPRKSDISSIAVRNTYSTDRFDYDDASRQGNRVVSLGEKPFFDPNSLSRREALAARNAAGMS
jgi:hypothetical protein